MSDTITRCHCSDLQGVLCGACREGNTVTHPSRTGAVRITRSYGGASTDPFAGSFKVWTTGDAEQRLREFVVVDHDQDAARAAASAYANTLWGAL